MSDVASRVARTGQLVALPRFDCCSRQASCNFSVRAICCVCVQLDPAWLSMQLQGTHPYHYQQGEDQRTSMASVRGDRFCTHISIVRRSHAQCALYSHAQANTPSPHTAVSLQLFLMVEGRLSAELSWLCRQYSRISGGGGAEPRGGALPVLYLHSTALLDTCMLSY